MNENKLPLICSSYQVNDDADQWNLLRLGGKKLRKLKRQRVTKLQNNFGKVHSRCDSLKRD